jgi:predicted nucleotidyltransferase
MINSILDVAYPGIAPHGIIPSQDEALEIARDFMRSVFPQARCAFMFGSYLRNEQKWFSDLDVFVILPAFEPGKMCEMQRVVHKGLRIEAFVYTEQSFLRSLQRQTRGRRFIFHAAAIEGQLVIGDAALLASLRVKAQAMMDKPRQGIDPAMAAHYRSYISSQLVKLTQSQDTFSMAHLGYNVYSSLYLAILLKETRETFNMDIIAKQFRKHDPAAAAEIEAAYLKLCAQGDGADFLQISAKLLDRLGGPAWHGLNDPYPFDMPLGAMLKVRLREKFMPKPALRQAA